MPERTAPTPLVAAAQARRKDAKGRIRAAVGRLQRRGVTIQFSNVADEAGVSRTFLYRNSDRRALVEQHRPAEPMKPVAPCADDSNLLLMVCERYEA